MMPSVAPKLGLTLCRRRALLALILLTVGVCSLTPARAAAQSGLLVIPRPTTQKGLSYFKLQTQAGQLVRAGAIELRDLSSRPLRVAITAVDGETLSTLGSGYASPGSQPHRSTRWLQLGARVHVLAPRQRVVVPVSIEVPRGAAPGDYLSGVSVEALDQKTESAGRKGISIASLDRYVIGVESTIAGPRAPMISLSGAELQRQPAGLTVLLRARNSGNVILPGTHGQALVSDGGRTVARVTLGPGTFVTGTSIAYPIPLPRERPREGRVYRVRASLLYPGGATALDTRVRFGRAGALTQQAYGGPRAPHASSSLAPGWLAPLLVGLAALLALSLALVLVRRRRNGARSPTRTLRAALEAARASGEPLSLITVTFFPGAVARDRLATLQRSRLRPGDRLCRLDDGTFLVVAGNTDPDVAEGLAQDLRRCVERIDGGAWGVAVAVHRPDLRIDAVELLRRISVADVDAHVLTPSA